MNTHSKGVVSFIFLFFCLSSCSKTTTVTGPSNCDPTYFSAISLDGINQKVTIADAPDLNLSAGSFTIEAICQAFPNSYFQWVIDKSTTGPDLDYLLGIDRDNHFRFVARGAAITLVDQNTVINNGQFYHLTGVID